MSAVCPLCNQTFSLGNIEAHASSCNGQNKDKPSVGTNKRKLDQDFSQSPKSSKVASLFPTKKHKVDLSPDTSTPLKSKELCTSSVSAPIKPHLVPLAERMRPTDFNTYSGQSTSLGPGSMLRSLLSSTTSIPSLILWGPPGCGKTTLANIISTMAKGSARFVKMSACTCGVAEVRDMVKQAKTELSMFKRKTILFMDEVHRFNKSQQDSFLPHIESGTITFIGATTENPSFCLNNALLSRCRVISLEKLDIYAVKDILTRALEQEKISIGVEAVDEITISNDAVEYLATVVDGDARAALNNLELVLNSAKSNEGVKHITVTEVSSAVARAAIAYDKTGDQHYHMASALQKSIRGGDDNAALYWLGRMLKGGENPTFIARRLVRCASEDIGLADNTALPLAVSAMQGCQLLGMPECDVLLAQCTVYLARAPKSHEVYKALGDVYKCIESPGTEGLPGVPLHLRSGGGKVGRELGWGEGYTHDLNKVGKFQYMPQSMEGQTFLR